MTKRERVELVLACAGHIDGKRVGKLADPAQCVGAHHGQDIGRVSQ